MGFLMLFTRNGRLELFKINGYYFNRNSTLIVDLYSVYAAPSLFTSNTRILWLNIRSDFPKLTENDLRLLLGPFCDRFH